VIANEQQVEVSSSSRPLFVVKPRAGGRATPPPAHASSEVEFARCPDFPGDCDRAKTLGPFEISDLRKPADAVSAYDRNLYGDGACGGSESA
jgi:hypothetical protein